MCCLMAQLLLYHFSLSFGKPEVCRMDVKRLDFVSVMRYNAGHERY